MASSVTFQAQNRATAANPIIIRTAPPARNKLAGCRGNPTLPKWSITIEAAIPAVIVFNGSLYGNTRRAIDIHEGEETNEDTLKAWCKSPSR